MLLLIVGGAGVLLRHGMADSLRAKSAMKKLYQIHQACFAYAQSHDQKFPEGKTSNEVFRQLFVQGLIDDEHLFSLAEPTKADGNIGNSANGFRNALEPGECDIYYIRNQTTDRDDTTAPLLAGRVKSGDQDEFIILRIGGNASAPAMKTANITEYLSKEFRVKPEDVVAPE